MTNFSKEVDNRLISNGINDKLKKSASSFVKDSLEAQYSYNFSWLGRPIIQYPQDILAMQEIIWSLQPDLIIETGIAHGGSLIFSASMLELNASCGGAKDAEVLGIDIDIRQHNHDAIKQHPLSKRIKMIEGSSICDEVIKQVHDIAQGKSKILVCLDSNHTHDHVLAELNAYAPLTSINSYCVVFDTIVEDTPEQCPEDRPWGKGNNPKTAVWSFLEENKNFVIDKGIDNKLLISVAPNGYLKRIS